jgi:peptidoglycan/LPS O-acetylase OafA/YrhL
MSNNYIALNQTWMGSVDHLWSLAVEEQFYLFFPFVVLLVPRKWLSNVFVIFVILAVALRYLAFKDSGSWIPSYVLMPACLDAFGLGAMLAFALYFDKGWLKGTWTTTAILAASAIGYVFVVFVIRQSAEPHNLVAVVWLRLAESLLSVALIAFLILNNSARLTRFFEIKPFVYIGKISYGIYIFHNFLYNEYHPLAFSPGVRMVQWLNASESPVVSSLPVRVILLYLLVIAIASISWFTFEKPINKLKDKYGY